MIKIARVSENVASVVRGNEKNMDQATRKFDEMAAAVGKTIEAKSKALDEHLKSKSEAREAFEEARKELEVKCDELEKENENARSAISASL